MRIYTVVQHSGGSAVFRVSPVTEEMARIAGGGIDLDVAVAPRQPGVNFRGGKNVGFVSQVALVIKSAHRGSDEQLMTVAHRNVLWHTAVDRIGDSSPRHAQSAHRAPGSPLIGQRAFVRSKAA
ncbi:hypothetical protein [Mycobacterium intracellulare]|uniref:hypothetical protein n=1 Tax=Mycobacterium intracellulare TaxID=1767 RepID=UPI001E530374|nr:hypothetical protein [Mycobacterium intracellulare]